MNIFYIKIIYIIPIINIYFTYHHYFTICNAARPMIHYYASLLRTQHPTPKKQKVFTRSTNPVLVARRE